MRNEKQRTDEPSSYIKDVGLAREMAYEEDLTRLVGEYLGRPAKDIEEEARRDGEAAGWAYLDRRRSDLDLVQAVFEEAGRLLNREQHELDLARRALDLKQLTLDVQRSGLRGAKGELSEELRAHGIMEHNLSVATRRPEDTGSV